MSSSRVGGREVHPAAALFPMMDADEALELRKSISEHGLREGFEIVLDGEGRILDGRNRLQACVLAGKPPRFRRFTGDDPIAFVMGANLTRRHLDASQRAMIGVDLLPMFKAEAEARRAAAAARGNAGRAGLSGGGGGQIDHSPPGDIPPAGPAPEKLRARDQAADAVGVSSRMIDAAEAVHERGAPELVQAVRDGQLAVTPAADLAELPLDEQLAALQLSERQLLELGKAVRARRQSARRDERIERIAKTAQGNKPLEAGPERYALVLADPAWRYDAPISASREIEEHYPTMAVEEICALPVRDLVTEDALLFMWATVPLLPEALRVLDAWGFRYATHQVWSKTGRTGMGRWLRTEHELLLWCVRGNPPVPPPGERPPSVIVAPVGEHSAKPAVFAEQLERLYAPLPKIELFARAPREGWAVWGNQAGEAA